MSGRADNNAEEAALVWLELPVAPADVLHHVTTTRHQPLNVSICLWPITPFSPAGVSLEHPLRHLWTLPRAMLQTRKLQTQRSNMFRLTIVKGLLLAAIAVLASSESADASIMRYRLTNRYDSGGSSTDSGIWFRRLPGETNGRWSGLRIRRGTMTYDADAKTLTVSARLRGRRSNYNFRLTYEDVDWVGNQLIGAGDAYGRVWNRYSSTRLTAEWHHGDAVIADFRDNSLIGWFADARGRYIGDIDATFHPYSHPPAVPEPGSLALLGIGMATFVGLRRKHSRASESPDSECLTESGI